MLPVVAHMGQSDVINSQRLGKLYNCTFNVIMKGRALRKQTACALNSALGALLTKSSHILKLA